MMKHQYIIILLLTVCYSCSFANKQDNIEGLVDKNATNRTRALYANLMKLQNEGKVMFGHQYATLYGREWEYQADRSDAKDVTGDHPALLGLDFGGLETTDKDTFETRYKRLMDAVKATYRRGGVVTFSWHMANPNNGESFYWEQNPIEAVSEILPQGKLNKEYNRYLTVVADFAKNAKEDNDGTLIPIIFRPFHEYDGDWFWWGNTHRSDDDFVKLWKYTVEYLKDTLKVNNFLYAFSPDCKFHTTEEYLRLYPGDEYVDILGMDDYWDFRADGSNNPELAQKKLNIIAELAESKNKVAALTETGLEGISNPKWYTEVLYPIVANTKIAYVQVWRNAYLSPTHYFVPTKGHPAESDFIEFKNKENILFESDLPDMY